MPAAQVIIESEYETGYTSGNTGNELDWDQRDYLYRWVRYLLQIHATISMSRKFYFCQT